MSASELKTLLDDHQVYHSEFQMDYFITTQNGNGTHYGMYKQALRELYKRARGLKGLYTEEALLLIDIEEMQERQSFSNDFDARRNKVKLLKAQGDLGELQKNIRDTEREFGRFYAQCRALKEKVGPLTPDRRAQLESDMWCHQVKYLAALDILTRGGTVCTSTLEMMGSLPAAMRGEVMAFIKGLTKEKAESLVLKNETILPNVQAVPALELRKLLDG